MNSVSLIARLGRDPELRYTTGNKAVCTFSVADSERYKDANGELQERTSWFDCEAWGRTGEVINEHFRKGQRIGLVGSLRQESWTDSNGNKRSRVKVVVSSFDFIESKSDTRSSTRPDTSAKLTGSAAHQPVDDSEIPF